MTEEQFFEEIEANSWDFTIVDETDEDQPVLQVGLVATFYLVDGYLPARRKRISEAFMLYCEYFGEQLIWGYTGAETVVQHVFTSQTMRDCIAHINSDGLSEAAALRWSSRRGFKCVGDYMFDAYSPAGWFEQLHQTLTTVRFYLPLGALKGVGKQRVEKLIFDMCSLLCPLHGAAGLGIQHSYEWENYQHVEYALTQEYLGVDLCRPRGSVSWRTGYTNLNWYTYLTQPWVDKLGTHEELLQQLDDIRIAIQPYEGGTLIRAGDWPTLGKADVDPRPELYVRVNEVLKPLRVSDIGSLHYGSIGGEVRFNERTSNLWMRRFDLPKGSPKPQSLPQYRRASAVEQQQLDDKRQAFDAFLEQALPGGKP